MLSRKKPKVLFVPVTMKLFWQLYPELEDRTLSAMASVMSQLESRFEVISTGLVGDESDAEHAADAYLHSESDIIVIWENGYVASSIPLQILDRFQDKPLALLITQKDKVVPADMDYAKYMESTALTSAMELAGALMRKGRTFLSIIGHMDEQEPYQKLAGIAAAAMVLKALKEMNMGNIGYPYPGMLDIALDEAALSELNIKTRRIPMIEVENALKSIDEAALNDYIAEIRQEFSADRVTEADLSRSCRLYKALESIVIGNQLNALTVHDYECLSVVSGTVSDFALSLLENRHCLATGVEGDVPNCVSAYIARVLSGQSPMFVDWTMYDEADNALFLQHNGKADPAIVIAPVLSPSAEPFGGVIGEGVVFEASGKPGDVTLVSMIYRRDGWHIFACEGKALAKKAKPCRLNQITVQFDNPIKSILEKACNLGLGHHVNVAYGHFAEEIRLFAEMAKIRFHSL
jgi:L-fucose isomerase-like protein